MAKGRACSSSRLVCDMISCRRVWPSALCAASKMKPMPPPDMPPSIQKPRKCLAELALHPLDEGFGEEIGGPGNDGLNRAGEIPGGGARPTPRRPRGASAARISSRMASMLRRAFHSASERSRYFSRDHFEDGADVLRHAAVDQHEAVLQFLARGGRGFFVGRGCDAAA